MNETIVTKAEISSAHSWETWLNINGWPIVLNRDMMDALGYEHGDEIEIVVRKSQKNIEKVRK